MLHEVTVIKCSSVRPEITSSCKEFSLIWYTHTLRCCAKSLRAQVMGVVYTGVIARNPSSEDPILTHSSMYGHLIK